MMSPGHPGPGRVAFLRVSQPTAEFGTELSILRRRRGTQAHRVRLAGVTAVATRDTQWHMTQAAA
eukprot:1138705-Rhodomonas_salina.2